MVLGKAVGSGKAVVLVGGFIRGNKVKQKMIKSKILISVVLAFGVSGASVPAVSAQEISPEQLAMASQFVDLKMRSRFYERAVMETAANASRTLAGQNPEFSADIAQASVDVVGEYVGRQGELYDQFARIYSLQFTLEELTQLVAFFDSELGRKLQDTDTAVADQLGLAVRVWSSNLNTEFMSRLRANLREKGHEF
ncbi:MAG: DUF2059 domain-containing protein [Alphaproteobacteria bacterium]|nr:DUF2059 domain-containing protein [Alphaproteobacteria bacterium]